MFYNKAVTYQQVEKKPKEKKLKQHAYEQKRKLVEDHEGNEVVKEVKNKKESNDKENKYNFKFI